MTHYDHPSDEGWIPRHISDGTSTIDIYQLIRMDCRECDWHIIVHKVKYKQHLLDHQEAHRNDR